MPRPPPSSTAPACGSSSSARRPTSSLERHRLACESDLVIRSREDDDAYVLSDLRDVELLSHGRVAVVNGSGNEIVVFDSAGRHVSTWGGTGNGPGEFGRLEWLPPRPPDSLAAADIGLRRVTILDADGRFVRGFATASAVDPASNPVPPRPMGMLENGSVIAVFFEPPAPVEGTARPAVEIVAIPPDGGTVHPVGTWPGEELALFEQDGRLQVTQPPFGRRLHIASAYDGVWIADDAQWEMRKYSARGDLQAVVRSSATPSPVSDQLLEELLSERYRHASQVPALEDLKRDQRRIARHTTTPSFGVIVAASEGGDPTGIDHLIWCLEAQVDSDVTEGDDYFQSRSVHPTSQNQSDHDWMESRVRTLWLKNLYKEDG